MFDLYKNIKDLRCSKGMTQEQLAHLTGYTDRTSISKVENGLVELTQPKIQLFANALGTTPAELMGWSAAQERSIFDIENIIPLPPTIKIPLLGTIACGEPILADENIEDYIYVPQMSKADFALRCEGNSMINARIFDGDIVCIRKQSDVNDGEIAAVLIGDEATLKRVHKYPNKLVLHPENPMFDDLVFSGEDLNDIIVLGKAVMFISAVR